MSYVLLVLKGGWARIYAWGTKNKIELNQINNKIKNKLFFLN